MKHFTLKYDGVDLGQMTNNQRGFMPDDTGNLTSRTAGFIVMIKFKNDDQKRCLSMEDEDRLVLVDHLTDPKVFPIEPEPGDTTKDILPVIRQFLDEAIEHAGKQIEDVEEVYLVPTVATRTIYTNAYNGPVTQTLKFEEFTPADA